MFEAKGISKFYIKEYEIIVDTEMMPILSKFSWNIQKMGNVHYAMTTISIGGKRSQLPMHRLVTGIKESFIDHINRNGLDNRSENIRYATAQQNCFNKKVKKNRFGFRGVSRHKTSSKFSFEIKAGPVRVFKAGFKTAEDAARAYDKESLRLHGAFGIRNFYDEIAEQALNPQQQKD